MAPKVDLEEHPHILSSLLLYRWIQTVFVLLDDYDRQVLRRYGLNTSQYRTLLHINEDSGERLTAISERLLLSKSTITRVIDKLEERDWAQRVSDPDDRRALQVVLTPTGKKKQQEIRAVHKKALDDIFQQLSTHEQTQLDNILRYLSGYLENSLNGKDNDES